MSTFKLRTRLVDLARVSEGLVEVTKNRAPWIAKFWPATFTPRFYIKGNATYPNGDPPYCAAAVSYWVREWLKDPEVLAAFGMTPDQAEQWRCQSPACAEWSKWARRKGLQILPPNSILKRGDIVIYSYSHIEIVTDDDGTTKGPFVAIGANTNAAASRDGEGCFEKPRSRAKVKEFIRLLPP